MYRLFVFVLLYMNNCNVSTLYLIIFRRCLYAFGKIKGERKSIGKTQKDLAAILRYIRERVPEYEMGNESLAWMC